jgi:hypothetical protein
MARPLLILLCGSKDATPVASFERLQRRCQLRRSLQVAKLFDVAQQHQFPRCCEYDPLLRVCGFVNHVAVKHWMTTQVELNILNVNQCTRPDLR